MKTKKVSLLLAVLGIATLLFTACGDKSPADGAETETTAEHADTMQGPYELEYVSNDDGTCLVRILTNSNNQELYDIVIPETSPDGDRVTGLLDSFYSGVPKIVTPECFKKYILHPLVEYYGDRILPYFRFYSLTMYDEAEGMDAETREAKKQEMLEQYPIVTKTDIYVLDSTLFIQQCLHDIGFGINHFEAINDALIEVAGEAYVAALYNSSACIRSVTLPEGITSIPAFMFSDWPDLTTVSLPSTLTGIGDNAFYDCDSLENMLIPDSVTHIGSNAFADCDALTDMTVPSSVTHIDSTAFTNCNGLKNLTLQIGDGITAIEKSAYARYANFTSIIIPDGVTDIGDNAFEGCTSLTSITIPDSVTSIGSGAFSGCSSLTSIDIPEGVKSIGSDAFSGCEKLTNISLPNSITHIPSNAFAQCTSLSYTEYQNGKYLGNAENPYLYLVTVTENVSEFSIPDLTKIIGDHAFESCNNLVKVTIPASVTCIDSYAFTSCKKLTGITYTGTMDQWNAISKSATWATGQVKKNVHCTDGDITQS